MSTTADFAHVVGFGGCHGALVERPVRADVRVRSTCVSTTCTPSTRTSASASITTCTANVVTTTIGIPPKVVIIIVEYRWFSHSSLPSGFSDFLIEFLGASASDTGGDEDDEEGETD
jgi:hypothetical protein